MTNNSTLETRSNDEQPPRVERVEAQSWTSHNDDAPLPERVGLLAPDTDAIRTTRPVATA
jgi:hypothetical protein